jgi:hypothetical protein
VVPYFKYLPANVYNKSCTEDLFISLQFQAKSEKNVITLIYSGFETGIWSLDGPSQRHDEGFHPAALYKVIIICASKEISRTLARTVKA